VLPLTLAARPGAPLTLLCLGAHADDLEIGCGGTILLLLRQGRVAVHWVVCSADARREREARRAAARLLRGAAARTVRIERFRDGYFPAQRAAVKDMFEVLKRAVRPDLILTHAREDAHQDHRVVAELTWNTFRDHTILEYEVPQYDGDLGRPNVFVPLPRSIRRRKLELLRTAFPSQRRKQWYSAATFDGLMRLRGVECAAPDGYAEAFHGRKVVLAAPRRSGGGR
jgi:LmbE family N-acetylglucosaminyl deacetylase